MPIYKAGSESTIIVPSSGGVLSDEQYNSLSPNSYRLDEARDEFIRIKIKIERRFEEFSISYRSNAMIIEEDLGTNFFSINNNSMRIVDCREKMDKKDAVFDKLNDELADISDSIDSINSKLIEVDLALQEMNKNYHNRMDMISDLKDQYADLYQKQPNENQYSSKYDYDLAYSSWGQQIRFYLDKIDDEERKLREDCNKTKNRISVSWYCAERG